jgi:hypothetical protein
MVTFAQADAGAFELNAPVAGQIKNARVVGSQMLLRSVMSYESASKAMGGEPRAFEDATKFLVGNMVDSVAKKLEIALLYGSVGYAKAASRTNISPTETEITITASEFAPGIWAGAENMPVAFYNGNTAVAGDSTSVVTVKSVDLENRKIVVTGVAADITAIDNAIQANPNVIDIFHRGAKGNEFKGIHAILKNTGSLFGIDASVYALWKGTEYSALSGGNPQVLSFAILQQAISKGVAKGLDSSVMVLVNPGHWDDLLTEQAGLRRYDSSYDKSMAEQGMQKIKFHSQNGEVEIVPSIHVKEGYAYILAKEDWVRIGSTDITFKRPGKEGEFFLDLPTHAGYELRCYTEQCIFCARPGRSIIITGLKTA